jgi:hypothetical protein
MVKSIIIIGSTDLKTSEYYKHLGIAPSMLITTCDHKQLIGHTSVGDVPDLTDLEYILSQAQEVYWAESSIDEFFDADSYYNFLNWLKDYNLVHNNVVNFNKIKFDDYNWNQLLPQNLNQNHAVFFGCSFTAGVGLPDVETHYATQVAKYFGKQVLNLGSGGGSNGLIFNRFTQLDFFPGQIVVVQLTGLERLHYCKQNRQLEKIMFAYASDPTLNRAMLTVYHKDFLFYELLSKIRAMVAIARAKKLKMVFWLADYKNSEIYSKADQRYFYHMLEFVPASWIQNYLIDRATDNSHPGVRSNKFIADTLVKYIETVYNKD